MYNYLTHNYSYVALSIVALILVLYVFWIIINELLLRRKLLKGKTVLITGSANGLGKSLCFEFARQQCHIICVDIDTVGNEDTINKIKRKYKTVKVEGFICDVTDNSQVHELGEKVRQQFGSLDILVNNAGVIWPDRLMDMPDERIKKLMDIDIMSHFWMLKTFLPIMMDNKYGYIVAIGSIVSHIGLECVIPYCAAKFGLKGLMEALHHELMTMRTNIKTLTVYPTCMGTVQLPKRFGKPGVYRINKVLPLHVLDTNNVARAIVKAVKAKKRFLHLPYYNKVLLNLRSVTPQFIEDFVFKYLFVVKPYLDAPSEV